MRIDLLSNWFKKNKRDFPWRKDKSPYSVWVSEVMLQQTQAAVVIEYFSRWMEKFPTIYSLAQAELSDVFKIWEGLGYYSRAKRLHEGAKDIITHHAGIFPQDETQLSKIAGIGPYTLGAILSFAFEKKKPAVDGNVMRVITRFYGIDHPIEKAATKNRIYDLVLSILPEQSPHEVMEALIELGAVICKKTPTCHKCPIKEDCKAFAMENTHQLPVSIKKIAIEKISRKVYLCLFQRKLLVKKPKEDTSLMGHLYQLPFFQQNSNQNKPEYLEKCQLLIAAEEKFSQSFTKYQVTLEPSIYKACELFKPEGFSWLEKKELIKCTFSSGDRKIINWMLTKDLL